MIYAVVKHDIVENVIVMDASQADEMASALHAEMVDALPYGLCKGDLRVNGHWTRNLNGEQVILESITPQQQTDYTDLRGELEGLNATMTEAEAALSEGVESIG